MNVFESILFSMILLLFPILCYLFYLVVNKNTSDKTKEKMLKLSLVISIYLVKRYPLDMIFNYLILTIPLFICYKRNYKYLMLIANLILTIICYFRGGQYYIFYIFQFIVNYFFNKEKDYNKYVLTCVVVALLYMILFGSTHVIADLTYILAFILMVFVIRTTLVKGEELMSYHIEHKNLLKEREIRTSLFKITHEIKNPLAVCKTYTDIFDYNDPECAKRYIPIISGEIDKMLLLLQDFMLVNKDNINKDIMDINYLLEEVAHSFNEMRRFDIELDLIDDEIFINGDYNRLTQVMTNLIKNGYEANADIIKIRSYIENKMIAVAIIDNGDGIKECNKDKIYIPFFTTKKDGTGLGVPLSNEIVEAHGGTLIYSDNKGKGTVAKITIPIVDM